MGFCIFILINKKHYDHISNYPFYWRNFSVYYGSDLVHPYCYSLTGSLQKRPAYKYQTPLADRYTYRACAGIINLPVMG